MNSVWNKEELADQYKKSIIVPIYKKGDKNECSHYHSSEVLCASVLVKSGLETDITAVGDLPH
jgi:hypothetical protein